MGWYRVFKQLKRFRRETETRFLQLNERIGVLMAVSQDIKDLCAQLDTATNAVAAEIQSLMDQISNGVSPTDAVDIKARLGALKDRLTALGQDPNNPVPTP